MRLKTRFGTGSIPILRNKDTRKPHTTESVCLSYSGNLGPEIQGNDETWQKMRMRWATRALSVQLNSNDPYRTFQAVLVLMQISRMYEGRTESHEQQLFVK